MMSQILNIVVSINVICSCYYVIIEVRHTRFSVVLSSSSSSSWTFGSESLQLVGTNVIFLIDLQLLFQVGRVSDSCSRSLLGIIEVHVVAWEAHYNNIYCFVPTIVSKPLESEINTWAVRMKHQIRYRP